MHRLVSPLLLLLALAGPLHAVAPLIGDVADRVIARDTSSGALFFVVGDTETAFTALTVTATSNNAALVWSHATAGTNAQRSVTVTPAPGQTGSAVITLTVTDGEGLSASSSFNLTVTAPNTPPTLGGLAGHQIAAPGATPPPLAFTVGTNGILTGSSAPTGIHNFTARVTDALGATATRAFTLTLQAPAAPTSLTATRLPDGSVTLTWPAVIGGWYQVETSDDLDRWTLLGSSTEATATLMTRTDDGTLTGSHPSTVARRFYRIRDWGVFDVAFTATRFNQRVIYDTTGFSTGDAHSIQNVAAINSDMLTQWQAWLVARGVLP